MSPPDSQKKEALTSVQSIASTNPDTSSASPAPSSSWRSTLHLHLHLHRSPRPPVPGKENWRDATLSEKERWREWNKAKDREQMQGSTIGAFTEFYKGAGKTGYWLAISE